MTLLFLAGIVIFCRSSEAIDLTDSSYILENYFSFQSASARPTQEMAFDPDGNIYVTHYDTWSGQDGRIYRIDNDRNLTEWITGLSSACGIIWAGGQVTEMTFTFLKVMEIPLGLMVE